MKLSAEYIDELFNSCKFEIECPGRCTVVVTATLPNGFEITESADCVRQAASYGVPVEHVT